jgi:hypothetical protein
LSTLKYAGDFPRAHADQPAIGVVVDDAKQQRPTVLHDDVIRVPPDGLHAGKVALLTEFPPYLLLAGAIPRQEVVMVDLAAGWRRRGTCRP